MAAPRGTSPPRRNCRSVRGEQCEEFMTRGQRWNPSIIEQARLSGWCRRTNHPEPILCSSGKVKADHPTRYRWTRGKRTRKLLVPHPSRTTLRVLRVLSLGVLVICAVRGTSLDLFSVTSSPLVLLGMGVVLPVLWGALDVDRILGRRKVNHSLEIRNRKAAKDEALVPLVELRIDQKGGWEDCEQCRLVLVQWRQYHLPQSGPISDILKLALVTRSKVFVILQNANREQVEGILQKLIRVSRKRLVPEQRWAHETPGPGGLVALFLETYSWIVASSVVPWNIWGVRWPWWVSFQLNGGGILVLLSSFFILAFYIKARSGGIMERGYGIPSATSSWGRRWRWFLLSLGLFVITRLFLFLELYRLAS